MDKGRSYHFFYTDLNQGIQEENTRERMGINVVPRRKMREKIYLIKYSLRWNYGFENLWGFFFSSSHKVFIAFACMPPSFISQYGPYFTYVFIRACALALYAPCCPFLCSFLFFGLVLINTICSYVHFLRHFTIERHDE